MNLFKRAFRGIFNVSVIGAVGSISFEGGRDLINDVKIERIQGTCM